MVLKEEKYLEPGGDEQQKVLKDLRGSFEFQKRYVERGSLLADDVVKDMEKGMNDAVKFGVSKDDLSDFQNEFDKFKKDAPVLTIKRVTESLKRIMDLNRVIVIYKSV